MHAESLTVLFRSIRNVLLHAAVCNSIFRMERKSRVKTSLRARVFGNAAVLLQGILVKLLAFGICVSQNSCTERTL